MQGEASYTPGGSGSIRSLFQDLLQSLRAQNPDDISNESALALQLRLLQHELRTPLMGILGMASLLLSKTFPEDSRQQLLALQESGRQLENLLDGFSGALVCDPVAGHPPERILPPPASTAFNGRSLVETIILAHWPAAKAKGLALYLVFDPAVSAYWRGSPAAIRLVLDNLLVNAIKFTECGHVVLEVRPAPDCVTISGDVLLSVTDTGCGIGPGFGRRIYAIGERGDREVAQRHRGEGFGLFVCQQISRQLGATLDHRSVPAGGTTFEVRVPGLIRNPGSTAGRPVSALLQNLHVGLLLGDAARAPVAGMLKRCGVKVSVLEDEHYRAWPPGCAALVVEFSRIRISGMSFSPPESPAGQLLMLYPDVGSGPASVFDGLSSRLLESPLLPSSLERMLLQVALEQKIARLPGQ